MKSLRRVALGMAVLAAMTAAGCGKAGNTQQSGANNRQNSQNRQNMLDMGTRGIITEVGTDSVTIAVMPTDSMQGGGMDRQPSGSGAPDKPSGTPPSGDGKAPSATMDTSNWEKKTYKVDSNTKINQLSMDSSSGSTALKLSDLKAGDNVGIQESSTSGTAGTITVMQGMPGGPGGQGNGPAPSSGTKS